MEDQKSPGSVQITLKDVYQQTQGLEKSLRDSLTALNLTMVEIRTHMMTIDSVNAASEELHREHSDRIRSTEDALSRCNLGTVLPDTEARIRVLERFKYTLLGAILVVNVLSGLIQYLLVHQKLPYPRQPRVHPAP